MNYQKHYDLLIERARNRLLESYTENHHIIPRCIKGNDEIENIVALTPEEHYVAHQLLVKIYPNETKLVYAAKMMTIGENRNNKLYGWLRRKFIESMKERMGEENPFYGQHHTEKTKRKISKIHKGKIVSADTRQKLSKANTGHKHSEATKQKISESLRRKG